MSAPVREPFVPLTAVVPFVPLTSLPVSVSSWMFAPVHSLIAYALVPPTAKNNAMTDVTFAKLSRALILENKRRPPRCSHVDVHPTLRPRAQQSQPISCLAMTDVNLPRTVGRNLLARRRALGLGQDAYAAKLGIHRT